MIIVKDKILFVHIPKTAGQSLYKYLYSNLKEEYNITNPKYGLTDNDKLTIPGPQKHHHMFVDEYVSLGYSTVENLKSYHIFTIVREPISRFLSAFHFNKLHKKYSYREYIEKIYPTLDHNNDVFRHTCPQHFFINSKLGLSVNKIHKIEEGLENTVYTELKKFGYNCKDSFYINKNKTSKSKMVSLSRYDIDLLKEHYKKDFELFAYPFT